MTSAMNSKKYTLMKLRWVIGNLMPTRVTLSYIMRSLGRTLNSLEYCENGGEINSFSELYYFLILQSCEVLLFRTNILILIIQYATRETFPLLCESCACIILRVRSLWTVWSLGINKKLGRQLCFLYVHQAFWEKKKKTSYVNESKNQMRHRRNWLWNIPRKGYLISKKFWRLFASLCRNAQN